MDFLIAMVEENFQHFPDVQQGYILAMETLQNSIGENAVHKEKEAICQQIASIVLFSGVLGLQANYHYFSDPVGGNFLNTDPEVYLRENIAKHLPEYAAAQQSRSEFFSQLDAAQREIYQSVVNMGEFFESGKMDKKYMKYINGIVSLTNKYTISEALEMFKDKRVLVLDDVMASGSTVSECVRAIQKYEPLVVDVITLLSKKFPNKPPHTQK